MTQSSAEVCAVSWRWRHDPESDRPARARAARVSGAIQAAVGYGVAAVFSFWAHRSTMAAVVASLATLNLLAALLSPLGFYARITAAVGMLGRVIGQAVTWLLMPILYFTLFSLFGITLRLAGKLRLSRRPDRALPTYWRDLTAQPRTAESYERQF
jgi:hypothetical protein